MPEPLADLPRHDALPGPRYGSVAMALHWLLALLIVAAFSIGLTMADMPFTVMRLRLYNWHKWVGVAILALSAVRLLWRLAHRPPPLGAQVEAAMPRWQRQAHCAMLLAMYLLFFTVPLLGWAYTSARGYPVVWFGMLPLPDFVPVDRTLADALQPLHRASAYALASLAVVHVAAVLKHQIVDGDGLLRRMLPAPCKKALR